MKKNKKANQKNGGNVKKQEKKAEKKDVKRR